MYQCNSSVSAGASHRIISVDVYFLYCDYFYAVGLCRLNIASEKRPMNFESVHEAWERVLEEKRKSQTSHQ